MKSVAQMASIFETQTKNVKPVKKEKSRAKQKLSVQYEPRIILPLGGIPAYYGLPSNTRHKSPKIVKNTEPPKPPEKIDKEKIKNNMNTMKKLLEEKGINRRPFRIEPPSKSSNEGKITNIYHYNNNKNHNPNPNQKQNQFLSHDKFAAAKNVFEKKNNDTVNKAYENKPMRKDVKKKAKQVFNG